MTTLYHNPRCSKSRETLRLLEDAGETVEIVRYLDNPPSKKELKQIISLLGIKPIDLVRTKENEWAENYKGKTLTDDEVRSEEHTSELQSRPHLVCRLLL